MAAARRHKDLIGVTEGDLMLLNDALYAGSDRLKRSSIGLRQGAFEDANGNRVCDTRE